MPGAGTLFSVCSMPRPLYTIALCWILLALLTMPAKAQFDGALNLDELYDVGQFGITVQAQRDGHVSLTGEFTGKYLVLQAQILSDWHLYSVTQPSGTMPSVFESDLWTLSPQNSLSPQNDVSDGDGVTLLEIRPTTPPRLNRTPYFDAELEEHDDTVTWILTFQNDLPTGKPITGRLRGQVCQDNGQCIPVVVPFSAIFNPDFDIAPLLTQSASVEERFILSFAAVGSFAAGSTYNIRETVNVENFWWALLFAFLGGVILNFMPCVLPVIGLKILSFFEQAGHCRTRAFILNAWYAAGMLSVFLFLAFLSLGLSILFTFDIFGIIMACIVFVMALSLMDIWTLNVPGILGGKTSDQLTGQEGEIGAFFKGIITTLLAIPCGAPLLSPAVNWADMQIRSGNTVEVFLMYGVIGIGMASPYLILGAFPELLRFLPKPGDWMVTFKKVMGFGLLLAVVWVLYFIPVEKVLSTVALLFALWFVCWLYGERQLAGKSQELTCIVAPIVLALVILFSYQIPGINNPYSLQSAMHVRIYGQQGEHWKPYSHAAFNSALSSGNIVVIDFTADWCVNCKVLEATILRSDAITTLFEEKGIVSLVGDCTRDSEAMERLLMLGPMQVPTLAIFHPAWPNEPTVIRGFYTRRELADLLQEKASADR